MSKSIVKVNPDNYYVVFGWMLDALNLDGAELRLFAIIFGFSQVPGNRFTGSLSYLVAWTKLSKTAIINAIKSLMEKGFINKYEYYDNNQKYCEYEYNREYVEAVRTKYETINSTHLTKLNSIQPSLIPHTTQLNTPLNVVKSPIKRSLTNNIDNNIDNNIEENKINTSSTNSNTTSIFSSTLKSKIKEDKDIKKEIKNKSLLIEKGLLDDITSEKLSDLDTDEVTKNREAAIARAAKREASRQKSINNNVIKARMTKAKELFTNEETLSLLEDYLKALQFSHNYNMSEQSWQNILDDIAKYADQPNKLNKAIRDSITGAYRKIYVTSNSNREDNTRFHKVDTKSTKEFTEEERKEFESKLARNADGSYMTF